MKVTLIAILVACITTIVLGVVLKDESIVRYGTFTVLSITLAVLVIYTKATQHMAQLAKKRLDLESLIRAYYTIRDPAPRDKDARGRTGFNIINHTEFILDATVTCTPTIYGDAVEMRHADFTGARIWTVFPMTTAMGWFEIVPILDQKGKSLATMPQERTNANFTQQLRMRVAARFRTETGETRELPEMEYFFDFAEWRWVPLFTRPV